MEQATFAFALQNKPTEEWGAEELHKMRKTRAAEAKKCTRHTLFADRHHHCLQLLLIYQKAKSFTCPLSTLSFLAKPEGSATAVIVIIMGVVSVAGVHDCVVMLISLAAFHVLGNFYLYGQSLYGLGKFHDHHNPNLLSRASNLVFIVTLMTCCAVLEVSKHVFVPSIHLFASVLCVRH